MACLVRLKEIGALGLCYMIPALDYSWEHRNPLKRRESIVNYLQITLKNIYFVLVHSFLLSATTRAISFRQIGRRKTLKKFCPLTTSAN